MKHQSYRNRIALSYMWATASLLLLVFALVYLVVEMTVYAHIDSELKKVANKHAQEVEVKNDHVYFVDKIEWEEREHQEADVNPVFVEIRGNTGELMDKSPNLKLETLGFDRSVPDNTFFNATLNNQHLRQVKVPVVRKNKTYGYIVTAVPIEGYLHVLHTLRNILLLSFPFSLLLLFLVARYLAGKSIRPVKVITDAAKSIRHHNLDSRIPEPLIRDELFDLTAAINELLDRIEQSMQREKQFTADAAHQLKTPLAVLKGTFEVLVRKPREKEEFIEKVSFGISEINRMSKMVEQLLLIARVDGYQNNKMQEDVSIVSLIDDVIQRYAKQIHERRMQLVFEPEKDFLLHIDTFLLDLIIENLLSNAIKYSADAARVSIVLKESGNKLQISVQDEGIGIRKDELTKVFHPFYRADALEHKEKEGDGLGLSLVSRACRLANIELQVQSEPGKGSIFTLLIQQTKHN
jgi:signal transduction histidine kinase